VAKANFTWVQVRVYLARQTDKAIGLSDNYPLNESDHLTWLPKSQLRGICYKNGGDTEATDIREGELVLGLKLPPWLAEESGLD